VSVLLLVRHGQASFGAADYDRLSELGERQSRMLGEALAARGVRPDLLVRGALRRHRQTAEAAVSGAGWTGEVLEDPGWDEFDRRTSTGAAVEEERSQDGTGPTQATLEHQVRRFEDSVSRWASGDHDEDYHESFPAFRSRVQESLRRTLSLLGSRDTAVVFTSGGPVSWVTAALTDGGVPTWRRMADVVVNSSVTKVVTGRRGVSLISFNEHSHLEADRNLITYR
jgi:broad specificity phosphatase PhoE